MMPHPQCHRRRPLRRIDAIRLVIVVVTALIVQGCATPPPPVEAPVVEIPPPRGPLVARDEDYAIVVAADGDDFARLAQRYLGDAGKAWRIAEFNGTERAIPGQTIVIPLRTRNVVGVQQVPRSNGTC